jgi:hypothetical protein
VAIVAIMTQITLLLVVCYEYQYVISGAAVYDSVEVVAGKVKRNIINKVKKHSRINKQFFFSVLCWSLLV